jgi:YbbR domain-containing protein
MKMKNRVKKHSLKFISAFLSVFLWVYVLNSEKVKFEKTVTLEYILPVDMMFVQKPVHEVTFMIEGPRAFVRTVAEREDRLVIDLNRANARRQLNFNVDINPAQLNLPFGMVVERVLPRKLNIRLEKKASKIVPLRLQFTGQLPDRLSLQNTILEPAEVEVYGPRSLISRLKELPVKPIELDSLPGLDQIPVEVSLPDDRLTLTGGFDVKFQYQLKAASSNFTLSDIPIRFLSEKRKIVSKVKLASVKLLVPDKVMKNRSNVSSTIQVWADIPEEARGRTEVPLKVILPPSIHLLEIIPKTIIVNIQ